MALCRSSIIVLSSKKKINFVQQVEGASKDGSIPPFKLLVRDKVGSVEGTIAFDLNLEFHSPTSIIFNNLILQNDKDKSNIQTIVEAIKASSKVKI